MKKIITRAVGGLFFCFVIINLLLFMSSRSIRIHLPYLRSALVWILFLIVITLFFTGIMHLLRLAVDRSKWFTKYSIFVFLSLSFILRIACIHAFNVLPLHDFWVYHHFASAFSQDQMIGQAYISVFPHTFGYPFFLSIVFKLFGPSVLVGQFFNILCELTSILLVYLIGRTIGNEKTAVVSAFLYAFWPSHILYSPLIASEPFFNTLLLLSIYVFYTLCINQEPKWYGFILLAFICSVANGIRPFGLLMIASFMVYYCIRFILTSAQFRIRIKMVFPLIVLLTTYFICFHGISSLISFTIKKDIASSPVGFTLFVGSNTESFGRWNIDDSTVLTTMMEEKTRTAQDIHNNLLQKALKRFSETGLSHVRFFIEKYKIMWLTDDDIIHYLYAGLQEDERSFKTFQSFQQAFELICNLYYFLVTFSCCFVTVRFIKGKQQDGLVLLMLLVLGAAVIHILTEVHGRYHYPVMSLLALFAGFLPFKDKALQSHNGIDS